MKHWFAACVLGVVVSLPGAERGAGSGPVESTAAAPAEHRAVLDRYCVTCHNDRTKTATSRWKAWTWPRSVITPSCGRRSSAGSGPG